MDRIDKETRAKRKKSPGDRRVGGRSSRVKSRWRGVRRSLGLHAPTLSNAATSVEFSSACPPSSILYTRIVPSRAPSPYLVSPRRDPISLVKSSASNEERRVEGKSGHGGESGVTILARTVAINRLILPSRKSKLTVSFSRMCLRM